MTVGAAVAPAAGTSTTPVVPRMPIAASGVVMVMSAGLGDQTGDESGGADGDIERSGIAAAALLIDEFIDDDAGIGGQAERGFVIECDAERGVRARSAAYRS